MFNVDFPSETTEVKFRTLQWICTEVLLALAALLNFMPRTSTLFNTFAKNPRAKYAARFFRWVFYFSSCVVLLDFLLNIIWLPIGTANTWGFRTANEAFMSTYNGTGAPSGWNWCLSYLATAGVLIGFDASGHVAEETKNASVTAARGIFWSTVVSGVGGLATVILFLFCAVGFLLSFLPLCGVVLTDWLTSLIPGRCSRLAPLSRLFRYMPWFSDGVVISS